MKQGYIFLGVDDFEQTTNLRAAYALSLTLKLLDPTRETCVVVRHFSDVPKQYEDGFDYIVELPFGRTEANHHDMFIDFWQIYYCTPFDENIFIDTYSIVTEDLSNVWDIGQFDDLAFFEALNYCGGDTIDGRFEVQERNEFAAFDAKVIFFRKSEVASDFFKMAIAVFKDWRGIYREFLTETRPEDFSYQLLINIVAELLHEDITIVENFSYVDLTINFLQRDEERTDDNFDWLESLNIWFTKDLNLKVNNYRQAGIIHYGKPALLTSMMINKINEHYKTTQKKVTA